MFHMFPMRSASRNTCVGKPHRIVAGIEHHEFAAQEFGRALRLAVAVLLHLIERHAGLTPQFGRFAALAMDRQTITTRQPRLA